jgi:hypothetical protein
VRCRWRDHGEDAAGSYVSVAALNANNQALGAPQNQANKVIAAPNQVCG